MHRLFPGLFLPLMLLFLVGCGGAQLRADNFYEDDQNFTIDEEAVIYDTADNRAVLDVLNEYRQALVSKDFGTLNRLVSDDYYSNAGTTHTTTDNYGRGELDEIFELIAQHAQQVRYRIVVKELEVSNDRARVNFEYEYAFQYQIGDSEEWDAGVDVMQMDLVREGDRWKITGGM